LQVKGPVVCGTDSEWEKGGLRLFSAELLGAGCPGQKTGKSLLLCWILTSIQGKKGTWLGQQGFIANDVLVFTFFKRFL